MTCPQCRRPIDEHDTTQAWACLDALAAAAAEMTRRACGGAMTAYLETEMRRPSPSWRSGSWRLGPPPGTVGR